jgi:hypothetical protein
MAIETIPPPVDGESSPNPVDTQQTITLPRKVVYFQAALLGVIATTFFVFGMMVGSLTSKNGFEPEIVDCAVSGTVTFDRQGARVYDPEAVVLILPIDKTPERRLNPTSIHPDSFDATDNDVIQEILKLGGAVVRTNKNGGFNVEVDSPGRYNVVVISKSSSDSKSLSKKQMAALSTYFMPVNDIRSGKAVFAQSVRLDSTRKKIGKIEF